MLSDERIRELALGSITHPNAFVQTRRESIERAIRLAVAETAEACAVVCDDKAQKYAGRGLYPNEVASLHCAAAIREKARERK